MVVCFEGPSAIGKTELSKQLCHTSKIIPEVNILYRGEGRKGEFWYYKKQVERYQLSLESNGRSILDGDIFQPLWYNWIYGYPPEFYNKEETQEFYIKEIRENRISFPDLYIVFMASLEDIITRKKNDIKRRRRGFEKHLKMIQPQQRYFRFLQKNTDINVEFVEYKNIESTKKKVLDIIELTQKRELSCEANYNKITKWLNQTVENI